VPIIVPAAPEQQGVLANDAGRWEVRVMESNPATAFWQR
jgi:hypothetical protein